MPGLGVIPIGNSVDVFIKNYRRAADETEITDGVLTFTIYDNTVSIGTVIVGPIAMPYQGSGGHFRGSTGLITPALIQDNEYKVVATDTKYVAQWVEYFRGNLRGFSN